MFLGLGHQRPISMATFTFTMRRHLIRLASAPFISTCLAMFGWVRFPCATHEKHNADFRGLRRVGENSDPILSRMWTKVHEIFRRRRKPLVISNALFRLSVSRFVQKIFAIKSRSRPRTDQMQKFFGSQFLWKRLLRLLYDSLLGWLTTHYLAKFGWVPFADVRLRSLTMKQLSLIHIWRCRRIERCRSRWSPYH